MHPIFYLLFVIPSWASRLHGRTKYVCGNLEKLSYPVQELVYTFRLNGKCPIFDSVPLQTILQTILRSAEGKPG